MNNCPNCGAPIEHYYNYQCPYCKTFLKNTDETVNRASNKEFVIDRVEIEPDIHQPGYTILIYGYLRPKFQYFAEVTTTEMVDIKEMSTRRGYSVFIPYRDILEARCKCSMDTLIRYIADRIPPELREAENGRKIWKALLDERLVDCI